MLQYYRRVPGYQLTNIAQIFVISGPQCSRVSYPFSTILSTVLLETALNLEGMVLGKMGVTYVHWSDVAMHSVFMVGTRRCSRHIIGCAFADGLGVWAK